MCKNDEESEGQCFILLCTHRDPAGMAEKISQRQPQLVRKPKGYPDAVRTGVWVVDVTLTPRIMICPLDEIFGGISAGSLGFPYIREAFLEG